MKAFHNDIKITRYPIELDIPEWIARVEDTLFEGMSKDALREWPKVFLESITPGDDLERIRVPFLVMLLEYNLHILDSIKQTDSDEVNSVIKLSKRAVAQMIAAQISGDAELIDSATRAATWSAARSAARAAESASWSAEWAAESAAWAAESAADSASRSATWSAVRSAVRSADSASRSASRSTWSADSAARSARAAAYDHFAIQLVGMLEDQSR